MSDIIKPEFKKYLGPGVVNGDVIQSLYETVKRLQEEKKELVEANMKEAIAFKNWCDNGRAWFFNNLEQITHTDEQLYCLFKQESADQIAKQAIDKNRLLKLL